MPPVPSTSPTADPPWRRTPDPRRPLIVAVLGVLALVVGVLVPITAAGAIPLGCLDGSRPPCGPALGTDPPLAQGPDGPPPATWTTRVRVLDQSEREIDSDVKAEWRTSGSQPFASSTDIVEWGATDPTTGTVTLTEIPLRPGGATRRVGLILQEAGSNGGICRSAAGTAVFGSGGRTDVVLAPSETLTAEQLAELAGGFTGRIRVDEYVVTLTEPPTLVPQDDGLALTVSGEVAGRDGINFDGTFTYTVDLHLRPSISTDVGEVIRVDADTGELELDGDGPIDAPSAALAGDKEPLFRDAVLERVQATVDGVAHGMPEVVWFEELGYTLTMRSVTTTSEGVTFEPALCRVA